MARPTWSGSVSFGLVNVGVKAFTAVRDHDVHFHQLEKGTGARIGYEKVSKQTGEPVDSDDIELGYEVSKGRYVTMDRKEVKDLQPESTRTIDVGDFVDLHDIDPIYYDRTYWLAKASDADSRAYHLLLATMEQEQRVAIGTVVMRNKQYLTAIRPLDGALAMSTMRFEDEVVSKADIDDMPSRRTEPDAKEMKLAKQILDALAGDWNPGQYHDTYTEELSELIEAKDRGDEVVEDDDAAPSDAKVLDLMEALQASIDSKRTSKKVPARKAAAKRALAANETPAKRTRTKTTPAKKTRAKKVPARKAAAKKAPARKSA